MVISQVRTNAFLSYFVRHKTIANLFLILMIGAGVIAFPNMRAQFFPDVVIDDVGISVTWSGAGAEDVDAGIVQVLEPALLAVEGVTGSRSTSFEGRASLTLEFRPGTDIEKAREDVQFALGSVQNLPSDAGDPEIRTGGWSDRVTDIVITGPVGPEQLGRFADELVTRLFAKGVTQTIIRGVAANSIVVEVPSTSLIRHDIALSEIARRVNAEVNGDPAGDVSGTTRVRTGVAKRTADDIEEIVLRSNPDGSKLRIGDVARVFTEGVDRNRAYFVGENPAVQLRVNRDATGDAIGIQKIVEEVVSEMQATLPAGTTIELVNGLAEVISARLNILLDNGLMGLGLVLLLLFLFLNARTAIWVAAGIPAAMFAAIALMYMAGVTINMISLFALIITLGIVVDDAIVVGEHADFRVRRFGEDPVVAAERAAARMFSPVFSATLTTVIAFFGLVAIGGQFGSLIADIPFTVIIVLIASFAECFLILPHHLSKAMVHSSKDHWYDWPSRIFNRAFDWFRLTIFRPFMAGVIWARYPVIAGTILILASQVALLVRGDVQWRFFNAPEQGQVTGNFAMLPTATRADSIEMMRELQRATEALGKEYEERYGISPYTFVVAEVGGNAGRAIAGSDRKDPDQLGSISINLIDADSRPYSSFAFVSELQENVRQHPLAETVSFRSWGRGPGGDTLAIQIFGADTEVLKAAAEELKSKLVPFSEVSGLEDSLAYDKEELLLELTPQGLALGLDIENLGLTLRNRLGGMEAATYPDGPRSASIRVALPKGELSADFMDRMLIRTTGGDYVPLADVVYVESRTGFSTVQRENGIALVSVTGDLDDENAERAAEIQEIISNEILPEIETRFGVQSQLAGQSAQERQFLADAQTGVVLVLVGIFLALSWIFGSWTRPLVVMAIIPFGLVGTIYGHYVWEIPMSLFTVVGLIGMVGIIINDSIVLVTTIDEYAKGRGLFPAIIDGASDRLRPVLLTTLTTVLGLTPLLYEGSNQAEFLKPTIVTLTFGLAVGMFLVLLVVPALIATQSDVGRQIRTIRRALNSPKLAMRAPATIAVLVVAALFLVLLGPVVVKGEPFAILAAALPVLYGGFWPAFGVYLSGTAAVLILTYVVSAISLAMAQTRAYRR